MESLYQKVNGSLQIVWDIILKLSIEVYAFFMYNHLLTFKNSAYDLLYYRV